MLSSLMFFSYLLATDIMNPPVIADGRWKEQIYQSMHLSRKKASNIGASVGWHTILKSAVTLATLYTAYFYDWRTVLLIKQHPFLP